MLHEKGNDGVLLWRKDYTSSIPFTIYLEVHKYIQISPIFTIYNIKVMYTHSSLIQIQYYYVTLKWAILHNDYLYFYLTSTFT